MIVGRAPRIRQSFQTAWRALIALFFWDLAVTIFYFISPFKAPALHAVPESTENKAAGSEAVA